MSREEQTLEKSIKKALSGGDVAPKRKHVRACIVYTWDHKSSKTFFNLLKLQPYATDELQLFKALVLLHKVLQEGHPSALVEGIRNIDWIESLSRIFSVDSDDGSKYGSSRMRYIGDEYAKAIGEYVFFLVEKLQFHKSHKGFNGIFEYEEYVSLVSVSDPNEGYETVLDLMNLEDVADNLQKLIFAGISNRKSGFGSFSSGLDCRGAVLIPLVSETYGIFKFVTSMMKALYKQMGDYDALSGLFDRYTEQCARLNEFYFDCNTVQPLKNLITIPTLPSDPMSRIIDDEDDAEVNDVVFEKRSKSSVSSLPSRTPTRENLRDPSPVHEAPPVARPAEVRSLSQPAAPVVPIATGVVMPVVTGYSQPPLQVVPTGAEFWSIPSTSAPTRSVVASHDDLLIEQQKQQQIQQQQYALQLEHQKQLQLQQEQQALLQQRIQQQEMEKEALIQQKTASLQNDIMSFKNQYERDQVMLEQYDKRVQKLESELESVKEFKEKYQSLAKLYSQLRQEHLNILKKMKKTQDDLAEAESEVKKLKSSALSNVGIRNNNKGESEREEAKDRSGMILKSLVESSIKSLQDPIASLDVSDLATDLSNAFIDGDINTIVNILPEFVSLLLRCPQEMQTIAEDFLRCLSSAKQTDSVINANIAFQEKLKRLGEIRQYSYRYGDSDEV
ncbi:Sla2p [Kluyveromyces lactis]|uniref:KLLA0C03113p n=3 Tax=Kluyveromyces lactis TaxID=28985 RepID=F2Z654_KLULA|nr:uncharacterized protein KLLA0_C03113g [Kluyveromyces lactis]CAE84412.1 Sla2 protein [Kluyveromyces lactis]CAH01187.1 KLLA0C03113p [Kluyveromyces lactis]|eukprot:XP_452336.1 uncharacterized protein KLLA0_C03113g [Kluyveromyces lactis]